MLNELMNALVSDKRNDELPEEMDWFGSLIGEWDTLWMQGIGTDH